MGARRGGMEYDVALERAGSSRKRSGEEPFRILVAADFSGREARGITAALAGRVPAALQIEHLDPAIDAFDCRVALVDGGELSFHALDDFHPDQLLKRAKPLASLVALRRRIADPKTAAAAIAELQQLTGATPPPEAAAAQAAPAEDDVARLLGERPRGAKPAAEAAAAEFIRSIVAGSSQPSAPKEQGAALAALDAELTRQLRALLHAPAFQGIESAWRSVDFLLRRLDPDDNLSLHVLDVSRAELAADTAGFGRILRGTGEEDGFALAVVLCAFGTGSSELDLLGALANAAAQAGAALVAGAAPSLVGCDSFAATPDPDAWQPLAAAANKQWQALRSSAAAAHVALALPRFLLRHPYGKDGEPIDAFAFEELAQPPTAMDGGSAARGRMPEPPAHEHFLWGNGAVLCADLLGEAFRQDGWSLAPEAGEAGDLPVCRFREGGETRVKPCAEAWLQERAAAAIALQGLVPLLSIKGRDAVRVAALHSLASPERPLALPKV